MFEEYPIFVLIKYGKTVRQRNGYHEGCSFYTHSSCEQEARRATQATQRSSRIGQEAEGMGTRWARALTDVSMGRNREAGSAGLGGVSLSNFSSSGAPGLSPVVWSLPSVIGRIEGGSDPECERTVEEGCGGLWMGGLHWEGALTGVPYSP